MTDMTTLIEATKQKVGHGAGTGKVLKFVFNEGGQITVDERTPPPKVSDEDMDAACTITLSTDIFQKLLQGEMDPTMAFMTGKLKINGDMALAMKVQQMLED